MKFDKNFKRFGWKSQLLLQKYYIDQGYSTTSYLKYFIVLFGALDLVKNESLTKIWWMIGAYVILCYIVGVIWAHHFKEAENEIQNQLNLFQRQMRKKYV